MNPAPTHVWLVVEPIDMRAGIDRPVAADPEHPGAIAVRRQYLRLSQSPAHPDQNSSSGMAPACGCVIAACIVATSSGPSSNATTCTLTAKQWQWLITGVDWQRLEAAPPAHWRV